MPSLRAITMSLVTCAGCLADSAIGAETRSKLEYFDLKDLQIVSVQIMAGKWRACVYTPKAEAVIVTDGDRIGLSKGDISGLRQDGIQVREKVLRGYDWVDKLTFLKVAGPIDAKAAKACKLKIDALDKPRKKR